MVRRIEYGEQGRINREDIEVAGEVIGETERAFKFFDGSNMCWLPKSQCDWNEHDQEMTMPEWLAKEKGLI